MPGARPKDVWRFSEPAEVELVARCCRRRSPEDDDLLDQQAVAVAEAVIRNGLQQFGNCAALTVLYSSFLMEVRSRLTVGGHPRRQVWSMCATMHAAPAAALLLLLLPYGEEHGCRGKAWLSFSPAHSALA